MICQSLHASVFHENRPENGNDGGLYQDMEYETKFHERPQDVADISKP